MFSFEPHRRTSASLAARIVAMTVGAFVLAWTLKAVLTTVEAGFAGRWPTAAELQALPLVVNDLIEYAILLGTLGLDLVLAGWKNSSLRRILRPSRTSYRDTLHLIFACTGFLQVTVLMISFGAANALVSLAGGAPTSSLVTSWPLWLAVPALYVISEFASYWMHRFMHTRLMWPVHAVHHSAEDFTMINTFRGTPVNNFLEGLCFVVPAALLGFTPDAMLYAGMIWAFESQFAHSNIPGLRWMERIGLFSPSAHRLHHSLAAEHHDRNFGSLICVFDRLFGTYLASDSVQREIKLGVDDPDGIYNSGNALRDMVLPHWIWLRGLGQAAMRLVTPAPPMVEGQRQALNGS